jgi:hypothetical protein
MLSVVGICIIDCLFFLLPTSSPLLKFFEVEEFTNDHVYKIHIVIGIVLCSIFTFAAEKLIAVNYTEMCDRELKRKKDLEFSQLMEKLISSDLASFVKLR